MKQLAIIVSLITLSTLALANQQKSERFTIHLSSMEQQLVEHLTSGSISVEEMKEIRTRVHAKYDKSSAEKLAWAGGKVGVSLLSGGLGAIVGFSVVGSALSGLASGPNEYGRIIGSFITLTAAIPAAAVGGVLGFLIPATGFLAAGTPDPILSIALIPNGQGRPRAIQVN